MILPNIIIVPNDRLCQLMRHSHGTEAGLLFVKALKFFEAAGVYTASALNVSLKPCTLIGLY